MRTIDQFVPRAAPYPGGVTPAIPLAGMDRLVDAVQTNCHIADANQATDASLCIYLLQMREFFRWEQGVEPLASLPRDELGSWLSAREALWASLEGQAWRTIPLLGREYDAFDVEAINDLLRPRGLVYGAGQVAPGRASFFLGELVGVQRRRGVDVLVCGCEHARGLSAPPAALAGSTVLLRRESLLRWLGEKYEAWSMKRQDGAFRSALLAHGLGQDDEACGDGLAATLHRMADVQAETLILHELGEHEAGTRLGAGWARLRMAMDSRRAELHLRALRDHLADCLVTLPALVEPGRAACLHFWFANLEGVRAALFPSAQAAYAAWCDGDGGAALRQVIEVGSAHWLRQCQRLCELHRQHGSAAREPVEAVLYADSTRLA